MKRLTKINLLLVRHNNSWLSITVYQKTLNADMAINETIIGCAGE